MLEIAFWILLSLVGYVYFGYPALLYLVCRVRQQELKSGESGSPMVTLVISAFNEEDCIAQKLDNTLQLDYPKDLLEILVVSDASDDRTDDIVREYSDRGVTLLRMDERGGKTLGLNAAVEKGQGDVVVFSDANAMYRRDAVRALVSPFADADVGAVVGESTYADADSDAGESESLYWRYETSIKRMESRAGSVVGGDGAIYAVRRSLYRPMGADVLSDFVNPLQVVEQGHRCVYQPEAVSVEDVAGSFDKEFKRKVRIVNRAWRATMMMKRLMNPFRYGLFAWKLVSHKLLRWLVVVFLMLLFVVNVALVGHALIYQVFLALQIAFYSLAIVGAILRRGRELSQLVYVPYYFCLVNIASARGILEAYRGKTYATWSTARE